MKSQSPIKRNQALVSFSRDHHFGLLLVWKIRQGLAKGVKRERISDYILWFFKNNLVSHFSDEEQMLFTELPVNDAMRLRAENEHTSIYELVTSIGLNQHDQLLLPRFADMLEKHIRFEERDLFRYLQDSISAGRLKEIEESITNKNKHIEDNWKDNFWQ